MKVFLINKDKDSRLRYIRYELKFKPGHSLIFMYSGIYGKAEKFEGVEDIHAGDYVRINENDQFAIEEKGRSRLNSRISEKLDAGYIVVPENLYEESYEKLSVYYDNYKLSSKVIFKSPMLAHKLNVNSKKQYWLRTKNSTAGQPKLDGMRALVRVSANNVKAYSRLGKELKLTPYILDFYNSFASKYAKNSAIVFDGELYYHGGAFQQIIKLSKAAANYPKELQMYLQHHIYDCYKEDDLKVTFDYRIKYIQDNFTNVSNYIVPVETKPLNFEEIEEAHDNYVSLGYEGLMLRNYKSCYEHVRSYNLLKVKKFETNEYRVVGVVSGTNTMEDCAIFVCVTNDGKTFRAVPKVSREEAQEIYALKENYIGKMLTVEHFGFSTEGVPRFPKAIGLRDYE